MKLSISKLVWIHWHWSRSIKKTGFHFSWDLIQRTGKEYSISKKSYKIEDKIYVFVCIFWTSTPELLIGSIFGIYMKFPFIWDQTWLCYEHFLDTQVRTILVVKSEISILNKKTRLRIHSILTENPKTFCRVFFVTFKIISTALY